MLTGDEREQAWHKAVGFWPTTRSRTTSPADDNSDCSPWNGSTQTPATSGAHSRDVHNRLMSIARHRIGRPAHQSGSRPRRPVAGRGAPPPPLKRCLRPKSPARRSHPSPTFPTTQTFGRPPVFSKHAPPSPPPTPETSPAAPVPPPPPPHPRR